MQYTSGPIAERHVVGFMSRIDASPTLADLFGDPITYGLMAADHVDYMDLHSLLLRTRHFTLMPGRNPDHR
jgi:hypothetical protein